MRVISRKTLVDFWNVHPDSKIALSVWIKIAEKADWKSLQDIKNMFCDANFLSNNRVVFNICGNKYRLVAWCVYEFGRMVVQFVGTQSEYDAIDARSV